MMTDPRSTRAVSNLVGFMLLVGILVATVAVIQLTAVPIWNEADEIQHSDRVMKDVQRLDASIQGVAAEGSRDAVGVELGLSYQTRPFLLNPPDPVGTLRSTGERTLRVEDAVALDPEIRDHLNGSLAVNDTAVAYDDGYHSYQLAPTTIYDRGQVLNRFAGDTALLSTSPLVDGRRISVVAVDGQFALSGSDTRSVDVVPLSAPSRTVAVRSPPDGNLTFVVPTELPADAWRQILEPERVENGGYVADYAVDDGNLTLTMQRSANGSRVTYDLRLAEVGVHSGYDREPPHYLDARGMTQQVVEAGQALRLTTEVRDRYNAPVSGVNVSFTVDGEGTVDDAAVVSTSDGVAATTFQAPETAGEATVTAAFGDRARERVIYEIDVVNPAASADGLEIQPTSVALVDTSIQSGCQREICNVTMTFENTVGENQSVDQMRLNYYGETFISNEKDPRTVESMTIDDVTMAEGGPYREVPLTFPPGTSTVEATFRGDSQAKELVRIGDIYLFSVRYEDGEEAVYFAHPT